MKKWTVLGLLWLVQVMTDVIRVALAVVAPTLMRLYGISPKNMGYVLSGWNWGYTASLPLIGPLVDRFGPWIVMGGGAAGWGLATMALPLASTASALFVIRFLFGVGHSVRFPAQAAAVSRWFDPKQRATVIGLCFSGGQVGLAIGSIIAAFILDRMGWPSVFYCIGGASLVLCLLWMVLYPERKVERPTVLHQSEKASGGGAVPLSLLLRHPSVWGMAFGQMGYLYAYFFFLTWLPGYLILERKMTILRTGVVASLPFWAGLLGSIGGGWMGDLLIRRGFSRTASRKLMIGIGLILATIFVVTAAFTDRTFVAVTLLTLCMGCMRICTASANSAPIDLAPPRAVGSLTSIQNFIGTLAGLLAAIVTGYIVQATGSFVIALVVAGGMALCGALSYLFLVERFEPIEI